MDIATSTSITTSLWTVTTLTSSSGSYGGGRQSPKSKEKVPSRRNSSRPCFFKKLPSRILLRIADLLPRHALHILAQTCFRMRLTLNWRGRLDTASLLFDRHESLEFLNCLSRNMLDRWVCISCVRLHAVSYDGPPPPDPNRRTHVICPRFPETYKPDLAGGFSIHHSQVQLALKYTRALDRLDANGQLYLQGLLAPYHGKLRITTPGLPVATVPYTVKFRVAEGTFIVFIEYIWDNTGSDGPARLEPTCLACCQYQLTQRESFVAANPLWRPVDSTTSGDKDIEVEMHATCPHCETDISLRGTSKCYVVSFWGDWGFETAPLERFQNFQPKGVTVVKGGHGRIRNLYESAERNGVGEQSGETEARTKRPASGRAMRLCKAFKGKVAKAS